MNRLEKNRMVILNKQQTTLVELTRIIWSGQKSTISENWRISKSYLQQVRYLFMNFPLEKPAS